jgi:type IV secretory pathway VirD2 relaxase
MEMKQGLQQIMERLFARQEEAAAQIGAKQEQMKDHQDMADAEAKARQDQLNRTKNHVVALLEGFSSCGKRTTACQILSVACP